LEKENERNVSHHLAHSGPGVSWLHDPAEAEQLKKLCRKPQNTSAEKRFAWRVVVV